MNWLIAPIIALLALATRRTAAWSSDLPGWTRLDAVDAADLDRGWGSSADALRHQLETSQQAAVTDGVLMVRREWSPDGSREMHVLYKKL